MHAVLVELGTRPDVVVVHRLDDSVGQGVAGLECPGQQVGPLCTELRGEPSSGAAQRRPQRRTGCHVFPRSSPPAVDAIVNYYLANRI
jgi:hypothetical protein